MAIKTARLPAHLLARMSDRDILLTRGEAATFLALSMPTLERWAVTGEGPPMLKLGGRAVRYRLSDLKAWRDGKRSAA